LGGTSADRLTALTGGVNGDVLGAVGAAESHVLLEAETPAHTHPFTGTAATHTTGGRSVAHTHTIPGRLLNAPGGSNDYGFDSSSQASSANSPQTLTESVDHTHNVTITPAGTNASKGSGAVHNNVQPTIVANYIIYAGV